MTLSVRVEEKLVKQASVKIAAASVALAIAAMGSTQEASATNSGSRVDNLVKRASQLDPTNMEQKEGDIRALSNKSIHTAGSDGSLTITAEDEENSRTVSNDSGVSLFTVLNNPGNKAEFNVSIPAGHSLVKSEDGGVDVITKIDGVVVTKAHINAPYAVDADGKMVPTHYEVKGSTLIQSVAPTAHFPVTADPKISVGFGVYIAAWGRDWTALSKSLLVNGAVVVGGSCVAAGWIAKTVWGKVFSTACGFVGAGSMNNLASWIRSAASLRSSLNPNACYQIRIPNEGLKQVSSGKC